MGEIMRWRQARSVQRRIPHSQGILRLGNGLKLSRPANQALKGLVKNQGSTTPVLRKATAPKSLTLNPYVLYLSILEDTALSDST